MRTQFNFKINAGQVKQSIQKIINYVLGVERFVVKEINSVTKSKLQGIVKREAIAILSENKIRMGASRTISFINNFSVRDNSSGNTHSFEINHNFLTQQKVFSWTNPHSKKKYKVKAEVIFNCFEYGRQPYHINPLPNNHKQLLVWDRGSKVHAKQTVFIPSKNGMLIMHQASQRVQEFIEALREKIKNKIKAL